MRAYIVVTGILVGLIVYWFVDGCYRLMRWLHSEATS